MKNTNRHSIKASVLQASTIIEFEDISDFCRFADQHASKEYFFLLENSKFAILHNSSLIQISANGFLCVEDYKKATQNAFPNATDYYKALENGITKFEDFEMIQKCGISDKHIFDEIQKEGFIEGFEIFKEYNDTKESFKISTIISNPFELYTHVLNSGFDSFKIFFEALKSGFTNANDYNVAIEKGFETLATYKDAVENGFPESKTYYIAREHNVKTFQQLLQKANLELAYPDLTHDQNIFLFLLSKLEQGKKASVNKLNSLLEEDLKEYKEMETGEFLPWFMRYFEKQEDIATFLQENENVKKFGTYDNDGEFFEVNSIKDRSVVIDGSNVAHNSVSSSEKPTIANLILMVKYLKAKGFTDILIIADASLRHKISDLDRLEELSEIAKYEIAPAATSADKFIISYVKSKHCLVISNDSFKEHKVLDPWTAMNIDFYRLTFMITDGEVFMPDLK